jgi:hypothetical protein
MTGPTPDESRAVFGTHDLHNAAIAEADDLADLAVAQAAGVSITDSSVAGFSGVCVSLDGAGEVLRRVGHVQHSVENLTAPCKVCIKLDMDSAAPTYRLSNVEDGYAEVLAPNGRVIGCVGREKHGSTRTGTRWVATYRVGGNLGYSDTRAAAVALVADRHAHLAEIRRSMEGRA